MALAEAGPHLALALLPHQLGQSLHSDADQAMQFSQQLMSSSENYAEAEIGFL